MKLKIKRLLGLLLVITMMIGLMPEMEMKVHASTTYTDLIPTDSDDAAAVAAKKVSFNGKQWHIIEDKSANDGSVTLLAAESFGRMQFDFDDSNGLSGDYNASTIKAYLDGLTTGNGSFAGVASAINSVNLNDPSVTGAKLYLLNIYEATSLPEEVRKFSYDWWLRSPGNDVDSAASVDDDGTVFAGSFYVGSSSIVIRPALQLNISAVTLSTVNLSGGANANITGGNTVQPVFRLNNSADSAMSTVTYTAYIGYHFEPFDDITVNGITVTRTSENVVTVSGTPTGDVNITIPNAVLPYAGDPYAPFFPMNSDTAQQIAAKQVSFNGIKWNIIAENSTSANAGSVTLLAVDSFGNMAFDGNEQDGYSNDYNASTVKTYLDGLTTGSGSFAGVASAIKIVNLTDITPNVTGAKLYLLNVDEANSLPEEVRKFSRYWWLRSPGRDAHLAAVVYISGTVIPNAISVDYDIAGVRPAMQLDLSKVIFSSDSKTFSLKHSIALSGGANATVSVATTQDVASGSAITAVTYTANTGYHFEDFADITNNGITATKTSDTVVTVSGIPTDDASITVPDAVEIPASDPNGQSAPSTPDPEPDPEPTPIPDKEIRTHKNPDGSVTTEIITRHDNGSVTVEEKTESENGSYVLVSETKDKDGKLLTRTDETKTISKKGTATVNTKTVNANGSTLEKTVKTTKKGYTESSTVSAQVTKKGNTQVVIKNADSDGYELLMAFTVKGGVVVLTSFEISDGYAVIPDQITVNGVTYPVGSIRKASFKNNKDIVNATIGKNVSVIGSKAFYRAVNLKNIFIYGKLEKVGKGAFKGIADDAVIKIKATKAVYKQLVELIKASGVGKNVKFKRIK